MTQIKYMIIFDENERPFLSLKGNDKLFKEILEQNTFDFYEIFTEKEFKEYEEDRK